MASPYDPHLYKVREAHRLLAIGMSKRKACKALKITGVTLNRLLKEYWERRKAGTLFTDVDRVSEADLYNHTFQMQTIADRPKAERSELEPPSTDNPDG